MNMPCRDSGQYFKGPIVGKALYPESPGLAYLLHKNLARRTKNVWKPDRNRRDEVLMREVVLQIPTLDTEQNVDIEVHINGKKRTIRYRVEIVGYEETTQDRVTLLRRVIREHDKDWDLMQIGAPIRNAIPVMFRKRPIKEKE